MLSVREKNNTNLNKRILKALLTTNVNPLVSLPPPPPPEASLFQKHLRGAYLREGGGVCYLAKTMVSVLHKELECIEKKLTVKKLEVMRPRIKNNSVLSAAE